MLALENYSRHNLSRLRSLLGQRAESLRRPVNTTILVRRSLLFLTVLAFFRLDAAQAAKQCTGYSRLITARDGEYCQCTLGLYSLNSKAGYLRLISQYMVSKYGRRIARRENCHGGEKWCEEYYIFTGGANPDWPSVSLNDNQGGLPAWRVGILIENALNAAQMTQLSRLGVLTVSYFDKIPSDAAASTVDETLSKALALPRVTGDEFLKANSANHDPYATMGDIMPGVQMHIGRLDIYSSARQQLFPDSLSLTITPTGCIHALTPDTQTRP